jgi:preprotein translocase subunit SecE
MTGSTGKSPSLPTATAPSRRFFEIYKRGQGRNVRMGTVLGGGIIILSGMNYLWTQLEILDESQPWTIYVRAGVPILFLLVLGVVLFWFAGSNRKACDFLIATEGEMKKVSWSSKREIIGSTKVVILFTIMISTMLFVIDMAFILFFASVGVLKVQPEVLRRLFSVFGFSNE